MDKPINVQPSSAGVLPQKSINKELNETTQQEIKVVSDNLLVCRLVSFPPLVDMALAKSGKCFLSLIFRLKIELIFQSENHHVTNLITKWMQCEIGMKQNHIQ